MAVGAQSLDDMKSLWSKAFVVDPPISTVSGNGQTTNGVNIALAADASMYAFGNIGAGAEDDKVYFGDDVIAVGTPYYNGTSAPTSFCLNKINPDGTPQWCIYSINGEISSGSGGVLATRDGGAVVVTALRTTEGAEGQDLHSWIKTRNIRLHHRLMANPVDISARL